MKVLIDQQDHLLYTLKTDSSEEFCNVDVEERRLNRWKKTIDEFYAIQDELEHMYNIGKNKHHCEIPNEMDWINTLRCVCPVCKAKYEVIMMLEEDEKPLLLADMNHKPSGGFFLRKEGTEELIPVNRLEHWKSVLSREAVPIEQI